MREYVCHIRVNDVPWCALPWDAKMKELYEAALRTRVALTCSHGIWDGTAEVMVCFLRDHGVDAKIVVGKCGQDNYVSHG